jgi:hypothetical protein
MEISGVVYTLTDRKYREKNRQCDKFSGVRRGKLYES